jgi:hypothetical protein
MQNTGKRCVIFLVFIILRWSFNYESNVFHAPTYQISLTYLKRNNYLTLRSKSNNIYLLTGYEGIASLLSPRHWLLTLASPRSIVRVEGTTNLLFPNTQSISILLYRKTLDSLLNDHLKMIKTNKIMHLLPVFCIINLNIVSWTLLCNKFKVQNIKIFTKF